jgi:hypothetical protein
MTIEESRTISRGNMWLIITVLVTLLIAVCTLSVSGVQAWARTIEDRGIDNQRRITALERQYAAIDEQLRASAARQSDILELLREHMRGGR